MKTEIFRLTSVDHKGISLHENGMIDFLYGFMLQKYELDYYRFIQVNQIDDKVEEFVDIYKGSASVHINIILSTPTDFDSLDDLTRNKIRLDIIHAALLRLSEKDARISKEKLEAIKKELIENNFDFDVEYKTWQNKEGIPLIAKIVINPHTKFFNFYFAIEKKGEEVCKLLIFKGKPSVFYADSLFSKAVWKKGNKIILTGKGNQMEITMNVDTCEITFNNLTEYSKPPIWEMSKAGISAEENSTAYENWLHSLPPQFVPFLRKDEN